MSEKPKARSLENSRAVITGGSSGIGWEITKKLMAHQVKTAIIDIEEPPADYSGFFFKMDLRKSDKIASRADEIRNEFGEPNILILNAGKGIHEKLSEGDPKLWEEIFHINLLSNFWLIRAFTPALQENDKGDVIFTSSVSAKNAYPYGGIYGATKAALDVIAETLRLELQPAVRVTTIHPGVVDTNFFKNMIYGNQTPESIGWGAVNAEEIANAVLFALQQRHEITLNDMVIRPTGQPL